MTLDESHYYVPSRLLVNSLQIILYAEHSYYNCVLVYTMYYIFRVQMLDIIPILCTCTYNYVLFDYLHVSKCTCIIILLYFHLFSFIYSLVVNTCPSVLSLPPPGYTYTCVYIQKNTHDKQP